MKYRNLLIVVLLAGAFFLRLVDLTDPPLDFNPTRQLRGAVIARGIYYEQRTDADPEKRADAIRFRGRIADYEPPILETLVAASYHLAGEEVVWAARIFNSIFWIIGGIGIYLIGSHIGAPSGGVIGLSFYLFLPLSVYASRSFQPDPWMTMWIILGVYALLRWTETSSWKWALFAGVFGGTAAVVKINAAIFLGPVAAAAVVTAAYNSGSGIKLPALLKNKQIWVMAGLMILPAAAYYFVSIGASAADYAGTWTIFANGGELLTPSFYVRWLNWIDELFGLSLFLIGAVGILIVQKSSHRILLLAFWTGYLLHGLAFPLLTPTHDYYHIVLIPLLGISLMPLAEITIQKVMAQAFWVQTIFAGIFFLSVLYPAWITRSTLLGVDFRDAPAYWKTVGEATPETGSTVGYSQDFGFRLLYYGWRNAEILPRDISSTAFLDKFSSADYFVVTAKNQMSDDLAEFLQTNYPVLAEGGGYVIYDLQP